MTIGAALLLASLAAGLPVADDAQAGDRTPVRCQPSPYYVSERAERMRPERILLTGSRVPVTRPEDRRARPCPLMLAPAQPAGLDRRVAD